MVTRVRNRCQRKAVDYGNVHKEESGRSPVYRPYLWVERTWASVGLKHEVNNVLLQFPLTVVQWADISCLQPTRDAMEVERVLRLDLR